MVDSPPDFRIVSIGTLSRNNLWDEQAGPRTPHATTTLIRSGDRNILVDPALPPQIIAARLHERTGLQPTAITDVFLTNFRPAHRAGLPAFDQAHWWIHEPERERVGVDLLERFEAEEDESVRQIFQQEVALLKRTQAAPDKLAPGVDLFPLPGFTPGTCGLLVCMTQATILIASDAIATIDHLLAGQVLPGAFDLEAAQASFAEAVEIADWVIPGHDNLTNNPTRRPF